MSNSMTTTPEAETHSDVTIDTANAASVGTGARKVIIIPKYVRQIVNTKSTVQYIMKSWMELVAIPAITFPIPTNARVAMKKYGISPSAHDRG